MVIETKRITMLDRRAKIRDVMNIKGTSSPTEIQLVLQRVYDIQLSTRQIYEHTLAIAESDKLWRQNMLGKAWHSKQRDMFEAMTESLAMLRLKQKEASPHAASNIANAINSTVLHITWLIENYTLAAAILDKEEENNLASNQTGDQISEISTE